MTLKISRKLTAAVLCMALVMAELTGFVSAYAANGGEAAEKAGKKYCDGYFVSTGYGKYSHVKIAVKIEKGIITALRVLFHEETPEYWDKAKVTFKWILEKQSTDVDSVSTATKSCRAIREAVQGALDDAEIGNQAGDPDRPDKTWFAGGEGTADDPYVIMNKGQLLKFAKNMSESVDYSGYHVKLGADIDLTGTAWEPCGNGACSFEGEFDGGGHTISGLTRGTKGKPVKVYGNKATGFFGMHGASSYVHDLTIKDASINVSGGGELSAGLLAGEARTGANQPKIEVYTLDDPEGKGPVNSEVYSYGHGARISHCEVSGFARASSQESDAHVGGFVGRAKGLLVMNSKSTATLESVAAGYYSNAGGIAGTLKESLIANSYARSSVAAAYGSEDTEIDAGILAGSLKGYAVNSYTSGSVKTDDPAKAGDVVIKRGEIAGDFDKDSLINCCFSEDSKTVDGKSLTGILNQNSETYGNIISDFGISHADLLKWNDESGKAELPGFSSEGTKPSEPPKADPEKAPKKPARVTGLKVKKSGKKRHITWRPLKQVRGYEIQLSSDRKFRKGVKKYTAGAKAKKLTIKKTKKHKYVRIRAFRTYRKSAKAKIRYIYGVYSKAARIQ